MNYRHAFHAGNFADIIKHSALLMVLDLLAQGKAPLRVVDTHAGRGLYDVGSSDAVRSGEAMAGIGRLASVRDGPGPLLLLRAVLDELNPDGGVRIYPGSPVLIARRLRPGDSYLACELRAEEHVVLSENMKGLPGVQTLCSDGFAIATKLPSSDARTFILIDPPFERADDYARISETMKVVGRHDPSASFLVWLPLKDLETLDSFIRSIEGSFTRPILVAEARMRPLSDPLRMNGCALVLVGLSPELEDPLREIASWVVAALGDHGQARLWHA